jgi:hypothetical protein
MISNLLSQTQMSENNDDHSIQFLDNVISEDESLGVALSIYEQTHNL